MDYNASWNKWTWGLIILTSAMMGYLIFILFRTGDGRLNYFTLHNIPLVIPFTAVLIAYLFNPQKYKLTDTQLIIIRPVGNVYIDFMDITEVQKQAISAPGMRTLGIWGLFGFMGWRYSLQWGVITRYATRYNNQILISTSTKGKIIITPDDLGLCDNLCDKLPHRKAFNFQLN